MALRRENLDRAQALLKEAGKETLKFNIIYETSVGGSEDVADFEAGEKSRPQLPARSRGATSWANNRMELST